MDTVRRLILWCLCAFISLASHAAVVTAGETATITLGCAKTISVVRAGDGVVLLTVSRPAGVYACSSLWSADPAPGQGKGCRYDDACEPEVDCPTVGTVEGDSSNAYESVGVATKSLCIGSCEWTGGSVVPSVCANGKCYTFGPFTATGKTCDPIAPPSGGTPKADETANQDAKCVASGGCPGTINGTFRCVPCSTKSQTTETKSSSSSSSAASGASSPGSSSQESGTTSKTTTCEGSVCTTTTKTTTVNPDGSTSQKTETKSEAQTDFCALNPKAAVCKGADDSKWGGACSGGFTCDGDAVQCAQAQASWKLACALEIDNSDPFKQLGDQVKNNALPDSDPTKTQMPGLGGDLSNAIDMTSHYSGACPGDFAVAVGSYGSFTVPLSRGCPYFEFAGNIGVALALIVAARIALGGS